jgi:hypothetical protein
MTNFTGVELVSLQTTVCSATNFSPRIRMDARQDNWLGKAA